MPLTTSTAAAPPRRGRPPRISPDAILDAVDVKAGSDWTMAGLAAELGVTEPAIYYHFSSKQALLQALGGRVIAEFPRPPRTLDWEQWLTDMAGSLLDCYRRHPFLRDVDMAAAATDQPASMALLEEVLGELVGCGFTAEAGMTALALVMLVVQAVGGLGPAPRIEEERARLLALASEGGARLTVEAYAHSEWSAEVQLGRLLPVVLAGIKAELAPAHRRGRS